MGSFLEGPNRAAAFGTLGSAVGIDANTINTLKKVYEVAANVLGKYVQLGGALITGAGFAVAGAAELVKALGLIPGGKSEFDLLYDKIKADLKKIEGAIAAASRHEDQKDLAQIASDASVVKTVTARYLAWLTQPKGGTNPEADAFNQAALQSEQLVARFYEAAYWQRLADDRMIVRVNGFNEKLFAPPPDAGDALLVWDYRATLPVFLKTIDARIGYLAARNPDYRNANAGEIARMADELTRIHNRIQAGIRLIPSPGPNLGQIQQGVYKTMLTPQWFPDFWGKWGRPCGAVDTIGGTGVVETFPGTRPEWHFYWTDKQQFELGAGNRVQLTGGTFESQLAEGKALRATDQAYLRKFNLVFLVRSLRARSELERRIGLPELRDTVAQLRALSFGRYAGEPAPVGRGASLREVMQPSADVLQQLSTPQVHATLNDQGMPKSFSVLALFGTAALTEEFARLSTPFFVQPNRSVRAMVVGG